MINKYFTVKKKRNVIYRHVGWFLTKVEREINLIMVFSQIMMRNVYAVDFRQFYR